MSFQRLVIVPENQLHNIYPYSDYTPETFLLWYYVLLMSFFPRICLGKERKTQGSFSTMITLLHNFLSVIRLLLLHIESYILIYLSVQWIGVVSSLLYFSLSSSVWHSSHLPKYSSNDFSLLKVSQVQIQLITNVSVIQSLLFVL